MGRYYYGDIEGQFWFAVQSSNAADRFGVIGSDPNYLDYFFTKENLKDVEDEIGNILNTLGEYKKKLDQFFEANNGYNDKMLSDALGVPEKEARTLLSEYADLGLGIKIRDCIKRYGTCRFEAEL